MENTKVMLAWLLTLLLTWATVGLIAYLLSDYTYRECMCNQGIFLFMFILGWIPALIVACDYEKHLKDK